MVYFCYFSFGKTRFWNKIHFKLRHFKHHTGRRQVCAFKGENLAFLPPPTHGSRAMISATRLGYILRVWATNIRSKVVQIFGVIWGYLVKPLFLSKKCCGNFLNNNTVKNLATFYSNIRSHWLWCNFYSLRIDLEMKFGSNVECKGEWARMSALNHNILKGFCAVVACPGIMRRTFDPYLKTRGREGDNIAMY